MAGNQPGHVGPIEESPAKRRRLGFGSPHPTQKKYDSQDDSGDELFDDYETLATLPMTKLQPTQLTQATSTLLRPSTPPPVSQIATQGASTELHSSSPLHVTQPTQILARSPSQYDHTQRKLSIVQVAASSPIRLPPPKPALAGSVLASAMAPAGTTFRPPMGVQRPPANTTIIDLIDDDDGPSYRAQSSDEDVSIVQKADITPSVFARSGKAKDQVDDSPPRVGNRFKEITSKAYHNPLESASTRLDPTQKNPNAVGSKRSLDAVVSPITTSRKGAKKRVTQAGPQRAQAVPDIPFGTITDFGVISKIANIRHVLPSMRVVACLHALDLKHGNQGDALKWLQAPENQAEINRLKVPVDVDAPAPALVSPKATAQRGVRAPNRTIQDKWSAARTLPQSLAQQHPSPVGPKKSTPLQPRKRLVQGTRPPRLSDEKPTKVTAPAGPLAPSPEWHDDSDSALASSEVDDGELKSKVLNFFNTCSIKDLADISNSAESTAIVVISHRPFRSLDQIRAISEETAAAAKSGGRKRTKKVGDRIVDVCLDMWAGYEAVDDLVTRCEALGAPVAQEMRRWGVDVFGATNPGELEIVSLEEGPNTKADLHDSGIGTPSSLPATPDRREPWNKANDGARRRSAKGHALDFFGQPSIMGESVVLKDYQLVGVNWLALLFRQGLSCILADEMGLGKTCQVIAFLAHLHEKGVKGPHLVVVPGSTLENWLREFRNFCPTLVVEPYYGLEKDREAIRVTIEQNIDKINVVVTTYDQATKKVDSKFLRRLDATVCVYDEGHALKNSSSKRYEALMRIPAKFRLLLTGTPLQNNLKELAALLGFILPALFKERREDLEYIFKARARTTDDDHSALLSAQRIARARSMMTPFVLRRKKHQVLKHLPSKTTRIEYCDMTATQWELYNSHLDRARKALEARAAGVRSGKENANVLMDLRKATIHPMLFRRLYTDERIKKMSKECLKESDLLDRDRALVEEDMSYYSDFQLHTFCEEHPTTMAKYDVESEAWMNSGKVAKLTELLLKYRENGDRVLVFSQFTMVLDILQAVMDTLQMQHFRLDGSTKIEQRQDMIDQFHEEKDITVFLLSTKAGGQGINLACANKVIIFDLSFNPQEDLQAENRAHRVGQTREVEVVRLITRGSVEEQIYALGEAKLALDDRVAGEEGPAEAKAIQQDELTVMENLIKGSQVKEVAKDIE